MTLRLTLACVVLGTVGGCCGPRADCHVVRISSPPTGLESEGRTYLAPPRPLGCNRPCGLLVSSTRNGSDLSLLIEGARLEHNGANRNETFAISLEVPVVDDPALVGHLRPVFRGGTICQGDARAKVTFEGGGISRTVLFSSAGASGEGVSATDSNFTVILGPTDVSALKRKRLDDGRECLVYPIHVSGWIERASGEDELLIQLDSVDVGDGRTPSGGA